MGDRHIRRATESLQEARKFLEEARASAGTAEQGALLFNVERILLELIQEDLPHVDPRKRYFTWLAPSSYEPGFAEWAGKTIEAVERQLRDDSQKHAESKAEIRSRMQSYRDAVIAEISAAKK